MCWSHSFAGISNVATIWQVYLKRLNINPSFLIMLPAVQNFEDIFKIVYRNIVDVGYIGFIWYLTLLEPVIEVWFKKEVCCFHQLEAVASSRLKNFHLVEYSHLLTSNYNRLRHQQSIRFLMEHLIYHQTMTQPIWFTFKYCKIIGWLFKSILNLWIKDPFKS